MPNQRAPGQKLLPIAVDEKFIKELDAGLSQAGYDNRSQFIRDAIIEKLERADVTVSRELALPPDRTGKGGRAGKGVTYPAHSSSAYVLNDKTAAKPAGPKQKKNKH